MNKQSRLWFFRATPTLVINCIFPVCFMTSCADRGLDFGSFMRGSCQVMSVGGGKTTYGTGFCVESFDGILTNYHVIEEGDTIYVKHYSSNKWYECENRAFSESDDLCLIKPLGQYENPFLPMRKSSAVSLGETVYTVGNIDNLGLSLGRGIVSSRYKSLSYRGKVNSFIQTDIEIYDGCSGGPLINASGEVIGMMTFRLSLGYNSFVPGVSFAIPWETIEHFCEGF